MQQVKYKKLLYLLDQSQRYLQCVGLNECILDADEKFEEETKNAS